MMAITVAIVTIMKWVSKTFRQTFKRRLGFNYFSRFLSLSFAAATVIFSATITIIVMAFMAWMIGAFV